MARDDPMMNPLKDTIYQGWPEYRKQYLTTLWKYWTFRCDLAQDDGLVLKGNRIVVLETLQCPVLEVIYTGHQWETKSILLARDNQEYQRG